MIFVLDLMDVSYFQFCKIKNNEKWKKKKKNGCGCDPAEGFRYLPPSLHLTQPFVLATCKTTKSQERMRAAWPRTTSSAFSHTGHRRYEWFKSWNTESLWTDRKLAMCHAHLMGHFHCCFHENYLLLLLTTWNVGHSGFESFVKRAWEVSGNINAINLFYNFIFLP